MTRVDEETLLRGRADVNFREMFRALASGSPVGHVVDQARACLIATGVPIPLFNPTFWLGPEPDGVDAAFLADAQAFYQRRGVPWALVLAAHQAAPSRAWLRNVSLWEAQVLPLLTHPTLPGANWPQARSEIHTRVADTPETVADHRLLLDLCFGIDRALAQMVLPDVPPAGLRLYTAYKEGCPVGSAALCEAGEVAGVYNVGTHPEHRRQGVAIALMRRVLDDARARGHETCVLQSSSSGVALYGRLGFRRIGSYTIYTSYNQGE